MRARTTTMSLVCAVGLLLAGCSSGIPGVPRMAGDAALVTAGSSAAPTGAPGSSSAGATGSAAPSSSVGGNTDLPTASADSPAIPTGSLPTDMGTIPGLNSDCLTVATVMLAVNVLFLGPSVGQAITKDDVDKAFADADKMPSQLQGPMQVLRDAATQLIGKSGSAASQIATSSTVQQAMDALSKYTDSQCGQH